jgi:hypothetical protein
MYIMCCQVQNDKDWINIYVHIVAQGVALSRSGYACTTAKRVEMLFSLQGAGNSSYSFRVWHSA